jgi:hypothetical protein
MVADNLTAYQREYRMNFNIPYYMWFDGKPGLDLNPILIKHLGNAGWKPKREFDFELVNPNHPNLFLFVPNMESEHRSHLAEYVLKCNIDREIEIIDIMWVPIDARFQMNVYLWRNMRTPIFQELAKILFEEQKKCLVENY